MWSYLEIGSLKMLVFKLRTYWVTVDPKPNGRCACKKATWRRAHTQREGGHREMEAETAVMPLQVKEHQEPPGAREDKEAFSLRTLRAA